MSKEPELVTHYIAKDTHLRRYEWENLFDWEAMLANYETGDPIGYGPTEQAAIAALFAEIENRTIGCHPTYA